MAAWDGAVWDRDEWAAPPLPGTGWGDDWRWWYQLGVVQVPFDITDLVVEARWTDDSHTTGDGSFRGDVQPGSCTIRLWDPTRKLDALSKLGAIWATYKPTGATWCWFYDSFTRGLFAPGDPQAADCVYTGTLWPARLTSLNTSTNLPSASASSRLSTIVTRLNALSAYQLPNIVAQIAGQSQVLPASVADSQTGLFPSFLAAIRDSATDGVFWWGAVTRQQGTGHGELLFNYQRWDPATVRILDRSQIVAGPPVTADAGWVVTLVQWLGTNGANGVQTKQQYTAGTTTTYGYQGPSQMRVYGDIVLSAGAEYLAVTNTSGALMADRANPAEFVLSSVSVQSGRRTTPTGGTSSAQWDPAAHVFPPSDIAQINDDTGHPKNYRVTQSSHRLTSTIWETTHTLEKATTPAALPA